MRKVTIVMALTVVMMLLLQTVSFAAVASGTAVIGDKGYSLSYCIAAANQAEITTAVIAADKIYVKNFSGKWIDNDTGLEVAASTIPAFTLKNADGTTTAYAAGEVAATATPVPATDTPTPVSATDTPTPVPATDTPTPTPTPADVVAPVTTTSAATVDVTAAGQKLTFTVADASIETAGIVVKQGTTALTVTKEATPADTYSVLLNEVQGANQTLTIDATDVAGNAATQKTVTLVDKTRPSLVSAQAVNKKVITITYSEKVDNTALNPANYTLYNMTTGSAYTLNAAAGVGNIQAVLAFTDSTQKIVKITIVTVDNTVSGNLTGFAMGGLTNAQYLVYVSAVADSANPVNTVIPQSNTQFAGSLAPDGTGANLVSSTFNTGSGSVTLNFDKGVTEAVPADNKISFAAGGTTANLVAADYNAATFDGTANKTSVTFDLSAAGLVKVNALSGTLSMSLSLGAFAGGGNDCAAATATPTIATAPILNSVTYNEQTNTAVYKFSKTIDVTKLTDIGNNYTLCEIGLTSPVLQNTGNSTDLTFLLSNADARLVEAKMRAEADGTLACSVTAGKVTDTDSQVNVGISSTVNIVKNVGYTMQSTAATFTSATYYTNTKMLVMNFSGLVSNTIGDITKANVKIYKDSDGTAGLNTSTDALIATFADTDAGGAGVVAVAQTDMLKSDATGAITAGTEATTLYINANQAGTAMDTAIAAAFAVPNDVYVVLDNTTGGLIAIKDAQMNNVPAASVKVTKINDATVSAANTDVTAVSVYEIKVAYQAAGDVAVEMDAATTAVAGNYEIYVTSNPLSKVVVSNASLNATKDTVTLVTSTAMAAATGYTVKATGVKTSGLKASDVTLAFNSPAANATALASTAIATADVNSSGTLNPGDTITVTFNEGVQLVDGKTIADYDNAGAGKLGDSTFAIGADKHSVVITLGSTMTLAIGDTIKLTGNVKDYEGNAIGADTRNVAKPAGVAAPLISSAVYADTNADGVVSTGDTIVVTFNQNVTAASGATLTDDFAMPGGASLSAVTLSGATASLTLNAVGTLKVTDNIDITNVGVNVSIKNNWNDMAATTAKAITSNDTVQPKLTGLKFKASTKELTFVFDEPVNMTGTNATDIAIMLYGKLGTISDGSNKGTAPATDAVLSTDKKEITITLTGSPVIDAYTTVMITAGAFDADATAGTDGTNEVVKDASGNKAIRGQGTAYTVTMVS